MRCSVLIPTYNSERVIERTLCSVFQQSFPAHEILVWDDGSSDSTLSILEKYGSKVTVFRSANRGVANARNQLCQRTTGELLAFLDHDDLWHPDYLKEQVEVAIHFPQAVAFYTGHVNMAGLGDFNWAPTSGQKARMRRVLASR